MSKPTRLLRGALTAIAVTVACAERPEPMAPSATAVFASGGEAAIAVERRSPMSAEVRAVAVIGAEGGILSAGGVTLEVPAGALSKSTAIRMVVPAGEYLQVQFAPHGLVFAEPALLSFDMSDADISGLTGVRGGYFERGIAANGGVRVSETFDLVIDGGVGAMQISHFSGYLVISNRSNKD